MAKANPSREMGVIAAIVLLLLFFYVYHRIQIFRLGYNIRSIEKQLGVLEKDNSFLQLKISSLMSPNHIASEVKRLGLDLVPPKEKQIIRVK